MMATHPLRRIFSSQGRGTRSVVLDAPPEAVLDGPPGTVLDGPLGVPAGGQPEAVLDGQPGAAGPPAVPELAGAGRRLPRRLPRRMLPGHGRQAAVPDSADGAGGGGVLHPDAAGGGLGAHEGGTAGSGLPARLGALNRLIQAGAARADAGFAPDVLADAGQLLDRAGQRLALSGEHTVVALAGGTGSGKSSLFNKLAGAGLSATGVTRPVTRYPHACVWGAHGSGPLLGWLGVPRRFRFSRGSALGGGEAALGGLVLLDLPDHDSVATGVSGHVEQVIGMADLMVWVLDPQKYADAAVHERYLLPLAGHAEVIAVVLNQTDLLTSEQVEECAGDLRRLLDSEGLHDAPVLCTSARTGAGLDEVRAMLTAAVRDRKATGARISADLDGIAARIAGYGLLPGEELATAGEIDTAVPPAQVADLTGALWRAAGTDAVTGALAGARELRAVDYVGWPVAWAVERLSGRNPVRRTQLGRLSEDLRSVSAAPSGAQQAQTDSALTALADAVGPSLPRPWSQTIRSAVRSRAAAVPGALGSVLARALPAEEQVARWWRLAGGVQGMLAGCVLIGLAWLATLLAFGVFHAGGAGVPQLFADTRPMPWLIGGIVVLLLAGWLIAAACTRIVAVNARRERDRVAAVIRSGVQEVARELVIAPAEAELAEYRRFREDLRTAAGL